MASSDTSSTLDLGEGEVAEPFRFNFEIAWEVANKGQGAKNIIYGPLPVWLPNRTLYVCESPGYEATRSSAHHK